MNVLFFYIALGLLVLYFLLKPKQQKKGNLIPGPREWPVVGSAFNLLVNQETITGMFSQYARQYGDIFCVRVFGNTLVVLNSADLVRKAFNKDPYSRYMNDRQTTFYGERVLFSSQSIGFTPKAFGLHEDLKKGFNRAMLVNRESRNDFEGMVKVELEHLVAKIESYNGAPFDIQDLIKRSLTNVWSIFASHQPGVIRGMVDFLIDEQLEAQEKGGDVLFTDERIIAMVLETIAAGVLTTLGTTSSLFLCLINHPEYQTMIQEELDSVVGTDRAANFLDLQHCPVTEAVMMEATRYITPVPLPPGHLCVPNIQFEGYNVEANSVIFANHWYIHHDERVWGDPWTFRPTRFLDDNGELLPPNHPLRKSWLPFGIGRRICVADSFARSRVFLYLTYFLQRWTLQPGPGDPVSCDPRHGHFQFASTCQPKHFLCRVVSRSSCAKDNFKSAVTSVES